MFSDYRKKSLYIGWVFLVFIFDIQNFEATKVYAIFLTYHLAQFPSLDVFFFLFSGCFLSDMG